MISRAIIKVVANKNNRGQENKVVVNEVKTKDGFFVPVIVDQDKKAGYETYNWIMKIIRIPLILILNMLPANLGKIVFTVFSGYTGDASTVRRWATTYKALEVIYTFQIRRTQRKTNTSDYFWELFLSNARSIRNRLQLIKKTLSVVIKDVINRKSQVNLISLGSGSARAIIETLSQLNSTFNQELVFTKLIDISRDAIEYSQKLAINYNIKKIECHRGNIKNLDKYCDGFQPDIVEMVGLLDYFTDKQAVDLVNKIYNVLGPNDWLISCNIRPNLEQPFVTKAINWPMIYREPAELVEIMVKAGFDPQNIGIIYEPLRIHGLVLAQKTV